MGKADLPPINFTALADALLRAPLLLEQEHLPARLPELPGE